MIPTRVTAKSRKRVQMFSILAKLFDHILLDNSFAKQKNIRYLKILQKGHKTTYEVQTELLRIVMNGVIGLCYSILITVGAIPHCEKIRLR